MIRAMIRPLRLVLLATLLATRLVACGPFYNDAHNGLDDPLELTLEEFYLGLYAGGPGDPLPARERALAAEQAGRSVDAQAAWREVLARAGGNRDAIAIGREARIHLVLLARLSALGTTMTDGDLRRYSSVHDEDALMAAATAAITTDGDLRAARCLRHAEAELRAGHTTDGLRLLEFARLAAISDDLQREISLLVAAAPALAGITSLGVIAEPEVALARLQQWLEAHPGDLRQVEARGWQAFIIVHQPACSPEGLAAAARIYQGILDDPAQRTCAAVMAVESLRILYRGLQGSPPPPYLVADQRHALAFIYFALRHGAQPTPELLAAVRAGVLVTDPASVSPEVLTRIAQTWAGTADTATALVLARRAYARAHTPATTYLLARVASAADLPAEAAPLVDALVSAADPLANDALMRLGSAWGRSGTWAAALTAYLTASSEVDVAICTDGEIPLTEFLSFMAAPSTPHLLKPRADGSAWIPYLRARLAVRLIRADRCKEALAWSDDRRRGQLTTLLTLTEALSSATAEQRPACLHALGQYWYDHGKSLVFSDHWWQQWAYSTLWRTTQPISAERQARRDHYRDEVEQMTSYYRAYPLFMAVVEHHPHAPDAPACLYAAALCRYWLCGQTYIGYSRYWLERSAAESYATSGDDLLRRLAHDYPDHPLAHDAKVIRAVSAGGLPIR